MVEPEFENKMIFVAGKKKGKNRIAKMTDMLADSMNPMSFFFLFVVI